MDNLLLILILLGDPSAGDLGKGLAGELTRRGGEQVKVLMGADAKALIEKRGVTVNDLLISPNIGAHFTAQGEGKGQAPIVLHVDMHEASGDTVVETRVWFDGKMEKHVAIAGKGTDPLGAVIAGVVGLIGHRLPGGAPEAHASVDEVTLAQLAEHGQWLELLGLLAGVTDRTPRQLYYEVLAYSKLGQRDPAVEALNKLRAAAPGHFLIAAAEELIPPINEAKPKASEQDQGGNVLRDAAAPKDDLSNVLK